MIMIMHVGDGIRDDMKPAKNTARDVQQEQNFVQVGTSIQRMYGAPVVSH